MTRQASRAITSMKPPCKQPCLKVDSNLWIMAGDFNGIGWETPWLIPVDMEVLITVHGMNNDQWSWVLWSSRRLWWVHKADLILTGKENRQYIVNNKPFSIEKCIYSTLATAESDLEPEMQDNLGDQERFHKQQNLALRIL